MARRAHARPPLIEELEPRLLYSADLAPALLAPPALANEERPLHIELPSDSETTSIVEKQRLEVVFIDTRVDNHAGLLRDIEAQGDDERQLDVVMLDPTRDGISQITDYLSQHTEVDALHLISHGSDGQVELGSGLLSADTLSQYTAQLQTWAQALSADADILIYGCDVASTADGEWLVTRLSHLTGADVAASSDITGSAPLGGDWQLEFQAGAVETQLAVSAAAQTAWSGTLLAPTLDLDGNDSSGVGGSNYAAVHPVGSGSVHVTDIDAQLADVDSPTLISLVVDIVNQPDGINEILAADTTGTSITANYDDSTGQLMLSGVDSVGNYQQVLRSITYQNTSLTPDRTSRTLNFIVNDGDGAVALANSTIQWTYVRDEFSTVGYNNNDGSENWNGGWAEVNDDNNAASGDVIVSGGAIRRSLAGLLGFGDGTLRGVTRFVDMSGASFAELSFDYQLSDAILGSATLTVETSTDFGGSWDTVFSGGITTTSTHLSLLISGGSSPVNAIRVLSSSSGLLLSGDAVFDNIEIRYDPYNTAAPALDLNGSGSGTDYANGFVDGTPTNVVEVDASLVDPDTAFLTEMVATIVNPLDGVLESLTADVSGTSILASYDSGSGTLTLSGVDTVANYQQVLRTLQYNNTSQNPNESTARMIKIVASDGAVRSNIATTLMTVTAVNDAPVIAAPAPQITSEDTSLVFSIGSGNAISVSDVDAESDAVQVTLTASNGVITLSGIAGLSFTTGDGSADPLLSFTGTLTAINAALNGLTFSPALNFAGAAAIQVVVNDQGNNGSGGSLSDTENIAVTVTPVNDAPLITSNGGAATAAVSVAENTTAVTTVTSTDVDGPSATYSFVGGADAGLFSIDSVTGVLTFNAAPNFEVPTDADGNNVYEVIVQVSDGTLTATQAIAVTVTNANEAPTITSNGGGAVGLTAIPENTTSVTVVTATDADLPAQTLSYSIAGGDHAALFTIDSTTGALAFLTAPNFEAPTDAFGLGIYNVIVFVTDGVGGGDSQHIYVGVTDANDAPMASPDSASGLSGISFAGNVLGNDTDEDNDLLTAYLVSGPANGTLTLNPDGSFSYTASAAFSGTDNFTYRATDGINDSATMTVTLSVLPVAVPPPPPPPPPTEPPPSPLPPVAPLPIPAPSTPTVTATPPPVAPTAPAQPLTAFRFDNFTPPARVPVNLSFAASNSILVDVRYDFDLRQLTDLLRSNQAASDAAFSLQIGSQQSGIADDLLNNIVRIEEAQISAVFLSAGVVFWGLRAGGLLASLLATLPAWRSFDMLPVIRDDRERDEPNDEPDDELDDKPEVNPDSKHIQELETET